MELLLTKSQFNIVVGNVLHEIRSELGLSQEAFAGNAGIGRTYYGTVERGEKSISAYNLYVLLESNHISAASFYERI